MTATGSSFAVMPWCAAMPPLRKKAAAIANSAPSAMAAAGWRLRLLKLADVRFFIAV